MQNNFKLGRPLLNVHRFEIRQFVRFWKLPIYSDRSNQKTHFLRNKIRKQLMPTLRIFFNPQIDTVLLNFVEIRRNEQLYFQNVLNFLLKPQECQPQFYFVFFLIHLSIDVPGKSKIQSQHKNKHGWTRFASNFLSGNVWSDYPENTFLPAKQRTLRQLRGWRPSVEARPQVVPVEAYVVVAKQAIPKKLLCTLRRVLLRNALPPHVVVRLRAVLRTRSVVTFRVVSVRSSHASCLSKDGALLTVQYRGYLNYFSRNQIVYWLVVNNNLVKRLNSYPTIFQKQILKTIFKTFNKVENAFVQSFSFATTRSATATFGRSARGNDSRIEEALSFTPMNFLDKKSEKAISFLARPINLEFKKQPSNLQFMEAQRRNNKILTSNLVSLSEYNALQDTRNKEIYNNNQVKDLLRAPRAVEAQTNEKKLTQLLILKFTKKLFVLQDKRFLLFLVHNLISKY